jgi:beta-lactamase superfamily II metal-dependent hydrolase
LHHHSLSPGATAGCWEALYPGPDDHFARADDRALVLLGRFYQSRILLLSGLGRDGQSALLNQAPDLRADVVVAGLPAQGEPLCDALLAAVRPRVIVIADAAYPVTRRAGDALKARLARTGMRVIYTRTAGAVTIVAKPGGLEI